MLRTTSIRLYLLIIVLFSISSIPVLGQNSNDEIIYELSGFITDGRVSPGLIKLSLNILGGAHQGDTAVNSYNKAHAYYNNGYYELALMYIDDSIEAWNRTGYLRDLPSIIYNVAESDSWNLKGLILEELGRYEEATSCFNTALDLNHENYYAWANMGDIHYIQGNYEEAIKCYNNAMVTNPSYVYANIQKNLALAALQSGTSLQENTHYGTNPSVSNTIEGGVGYGVSAISMNGYNSGCIAGSGNIISENRIVNKFDSIDLRLSGNLYLTQDAHQSVRIEGDDNILKVLVTNVADETLIVDSGGCIQPTKPIKIYVSAEEIRQLNSGSGNIISQSQINSDTLDVEITGSGSSDLSLNVGELNTAITGSGNIYLSGAAKIHNSELSGSGNVRAFDLTTDITDITVSGSGNAQVNVFETLDVDIFGSGIVYYKGDATVNQNIFGAGRLIKS